MNKIIKIVIIVLVVGAVLAGGYYYFTNTDGETGVLIVRESFDSSEAVSSEHRQFLNLLRSIENIELDDSVFSRNDFNSLVDFSQIISPRPKGRNNPFLPVSLFDLASPPSTSNQ